METYLTVVFWMQLMRLIIRTLTIGIADYPREKEYTMGFDICVLILTVPFFVWVIYLKWFVV